MPLLGQASNALHTQKPLRSMLDPLTALSVASSVIQFVDFASKIVGKASEIREAGSTVDVVVLNQVTNDLVQLNDLLISQSHPTGHPGVVQDQLYDLARSCNAIAEELIQALQKLGLSNSRSRWKSLRAALKTAWNKDKIESLAQRLQLLRNELALRLLVTLNQRSTDESNQLVRLHSDNAQLHSDIVEVISINQSSLQSLLGENSIEAQKRHEEIVAAILALRDGTLKTLNSPSVGPTSTANGIDASQSWSTVRYGSDNTDDTRQTATITQDDFSSISAEILDLLYFRQLSDRIENISDPHKDTFQWIYRDPTVSQKPWSNLTEWLEQGKGLYWINGKAGSGKSTLMKYILADSRTYQFLNVWAGNRTLVTASFFCWNAGTSLQKSEVGLFRSLLYDILTVCPQLMPSVFPELYRSLVNHRGRQIEGLTLTELRKAFRRLTAQTTYTVKICLFVDGVDEYGGDPTDLCDMLTKLSNSTFVKIVASSRPIQACITSFASLPSLRLQDLTSKDIKQYVEDHLAGNPRMRDLERDEGAAVQEFVDDVVQRASGVFLWVILVVRSLLRGLRNADTTVELRGRLDELPPELEDLYLQMLGRMEPLYQRQASELFQIAVASLSVQGNDPLTLRQMCYASEEQVDSVISMKNVPVGRREGDSRYRRTEQRLISRCCGLVEIEDKKIHTSRYSTRSRAIVTFLHKSVFDFLRVDKIWQGLVDMTKDTPFDANVALLSSCIAEIKISRAPIQIDPTDDDGWAYMHHALHYALRVEQSTGRAPTALLDALDAVMTANWQAAKEYYAKPDDDWCPIDPQYHWAVAEFISGTASTFLHGNGARLRGEALSNPERITFLKLAQAWGLDLYAEKKLRQQMSKKTLQ